LIWIKGEACCGLTIRHSGDCKSSGPMRRAVLYLETLIATGVSRATPGAAVIQAPTRKEER
jgi:hypothetical protein